MGEHGGKASFPLDPGRRPYRRGRYCSKCNGYYCYCMNHINNHTHVQ